jgi:hypothetical protein
MFRWAEANSGFAEETWAHRAPGTIVAEAALACLTEA